MNANTRLACIVALTVALCTSASAQGKKSKPPAKYPATAAFRCVPLAGCGVADGIGAGDAGDNGDYSPLVNAFGGAGLYSANLEMHIGLDTGGVSYYSVQFDLSNVRVPGPCVATGSCRYPASSGPFVETGVAEIQSNVVDANGAEVANGLFSLHVNQQAHTRFRIGFRHPADTRLAWTLDFSSVQYQGATDATVTRTARCTWVFEATANDRAGLWAFGNLTSRGKATRTDEGLYSAPFKLTFTADASSGCESVP